MTLAEQLAPIATRLAHILEAKTELDAEEKTLKAQIRDLVPGPDTYTAGNYTLTISHNRRFDPKKAEQILPTELLDLCRVSKIDPTAAKNVLPPALYSECMAQVGDDVIRFAR